MNKNAERFAAWLMETHRMTGLSMENAGDPQHTVIFRTQLPVGPALAETPSHDDDTTTGDAPADAMHPRRIPLGILLDDTIFALIRVNFATRALDDMNAFAVQQFLAKRNYEDKLFKYYLAPDTTILLDACIPQPQGAFRPDFLWACAELVAREAREQAAAIFDRVGRE